MRASLSSLLTRLLLILLLFASTSPAALATPPTILFHNNNQPAESVESNPTRASPDFVSAGLGLARGLHRRDLDDLTKTSFWNGDVWTGKNYCLAASTSFVIMPTVAGMYKTLFSFNVYRRIGNRSITLPGRLGSDNVRFKAVLQEETSGRRAMYRNTSVVRDMLADLYAAVVNESNSAVMARGLASLSGSAEQAGSVFKVFTGIAVPKTTVTVNVMGAVKPDADQVSAAIEVWWDQHHASAPGEMSPDTLILSSSDLNPNMGSLEQRQSSNLSPCVSFATSPTVRWIEPEFAWSGIGVTPGGDCLTNNTDSATGMRVDCSLCCNGCNRFGTCCGDGRSPEECGVCEAC